jgi:hypothetical protein
MRGMLLCPPLYCWLDASILRRRLAGFLRREQPCREQPLQLPQKPVVARAVLPAERGQPVHMKTINHAVAVVYQAFDELNLRSQLRGSAGHGRCALLQRGAWGHRQQQPLLHQRQGARKWKHARFWRSAYFPLLERGKQRMLFPAAHLGGWRFKNQQN